MGQAVREDHSKHVNAALHLDAHARPEETSIPVGQRIATASPRDMSDVSKVSLEVPSNTPVGMYSPCESPRIGQDPCPDCRGRAGQCVWVDDETTEQLSEAIANMRAWKRRQGSPVLSARSAAAGDLNLCSM